MDRTARPSLIALQPARLAATLRLLNPMPRELLLQRPYPTPLPHGWGILPASTSPLLVDLMDMDLPLIAMILSNLVRRQREQNTVPLLFVPSVATGVKLLIASSSLSCIVTPTEAPAETIARWVAAPVHIMEGQVWIRCWPPPPPHLDSRFIPLLAALSRANSFVQAAEWCYLSQRTVYNILTETCTVLGITPKGRHSSPAQWVSFFSDALSNIDTRAVS
jgi:hypothetical protein